MQLVNKLLKLLVPDILDSGKQKRKSYVVVGFPLPFSTVTVCYTEFLIILFSSYLQMNMFNLQFYRSLSLFKGGLLQSHFSLGACSHSITSVSVKQNWLRSKSANPRLSAPPNGLTTRSDEVLSDAKLEAGTANHEGMAGLQQPLVHTVMETLSLLHTTKNNTLSPLLHIKKFTTCYLAVTPKEFGLLHYPTYRASLLIIYVTCAVRDLHLNWHNRCNAGIS